MFDFELEWTVGGRGRRKAAKTAFFQLPHPPSPPFPLTIAHPTGTLSFSPQPSAAVKIEDRSYNFQQQNTEESLVKTTPALQARLRFSNFDWE